MECTPLFCWPHRIRTCKPVWVSSSKGNAIAVLPEVSGWGSRVLTYISASNGSTFKCTLFLLSYTPFCCLEGNRTPTFILQRELCYQLHHETISHNLSRFWVSNLLPQIHSLIHHRNASNTIWSNRQDSNLRSLHPKCSTIPTSLLLDICRKYLLNLRQDFQRTI